MAYSKSIPTDRFLEAREKGEIIEFVEMGYHADDIAIYYDCTPDMVKRALPTPMRKKLLSNKLRRTIPTDEFIRSLALHMPWGSRV